MPFVKDLTRLPPQHRSVGRGDKNLHRTRGIPGSGSQSAFLSRFSSTGLMASPANFDTSYLLSVLDPGLSDTEDGLSHLQKRVEDLRSREDCESRMEECYCIMFNPNSDSEGIHTIEVPPSSGRNFLLAFEAKEDCVRFSLVLRAQGFFEPVAEKIVFTDVKSFCSNTDVNYLVVPKGTRLSPPVVNKEDVDFVPEDTPGPRRKGKKDVHLSTDDLKSLKISLERSFLMSEE